MITRIDRLRSQLLVQSESVVGSDDRGLEMQGLPTERAGYHNQQATQYIDKKKLLLS
ncbi:MAG: hypothetical protein R3C01_08515 [Planctomycetaceae bacterium]